MVFSAAEDNTAQISFENQVIARRPPPLSSVSQCYAHCSITSVQSKLEAEATREHCEPDFSALPFLYIL
ncbi:hypothetical protein Ocin01_06472 [Orchesella cincta]|uniref:Uncharacterized protein n=1 Tax=Orchesella cincta TaxID=48709 RepID=A0A1D2N5H9_ORCCI|nr:hypothetical protein Ocin01_06472 [Orchesella cincta]